MKNIFSVAQFTATPYNTAEDKVKWANAMASWVQRGFPESGWRKGLYDGLYIHMYSHIAEYNQYGFYCVWFDGIDKQLQWLKYASKGGYLPGGAGHPEYTWSDVEKAFSAWIKENGFIAKYQKLVDDSIETQERAQLSHLLKKYGISE